MESVYCFVAERHFFGIGKCIFFRRKRKKELGAGSMPYFGKKKKKRRGWKAGKYTVFYTRKNRVESATCTFF